MILLGSILPRSVMGMEGLMAQHKFGVILNDRNDHCLITRGIPPERGLRL